MSDAPRYLTDAAFVGYAMRLAQTAASWSADTVQFSEELGAVADRNPIMRHGAEWDFPLQILAVPEVLVRDLEIEDVGDRFGIPSARRRR